jgi:hypothetical protein
LSPTVFRIGSYRFHFYSDEKNEPPHTYIEISDREYNLVKTDSVSKKPLYIVSSFTKIEKLVLENINLFIEKYNEYHNS